MSILSLLMTVVLFIDSLKASSKRWLTRKLPEGIDFIKKAREDVATTGLKVVVNYHEGKIHIIKATQPDMDKPVEFEHAGPFEFFMLSLLQKEIHRQPAGCKVKFEDNGVRTANSNERLPIKKYDAVYDLIPVQQDTR